MKYRLLFAFLFLSGSLRAQQYGVYHHFEVSSDKKSNGAADMTFMDTVVTGMLQRGNSLPPLRIKGVVQAATIRLSFLANDSLVMTFEGKAEKNSTQISGKTSAGEFWQFRYDSAKMRSLSVIRDTLHYVWRKNQSGTPLGCNNIYQFLFFPDNPAGDAAQKVNENLLDETLVGSEPVEELRKIAINAMDDDFTSIVDSYNDAFRDSTSYDQIKYMNEAPQVYIWQSQQIRQVVYDRNDLMTVEFFTYSYTGGAHGNYEYVYNNFDLKTGDSFSWDDAFKAGYQNQLIILITQALRKKYHLKPEQTLADAGMLVNEVPQPASFFVSDYGLGMLYNPYDIAPYVYGTITLFIPWSDLKGIINPAGALGRMIK